MTFPWGEAVRGISGQLGMSRNCLQRGVRRSGEAPLRMPPALRGATAPTGPGSLWAVFLYRLPRSEGASAGDPALLDRLRALPYEGAILLRTIGRSGNLLCWKEEALRPRDMEGLVERVVNVPAFARACADLEAIQAHALGTAAARSGSRVEPQTNTFTAFGATWQLGAAFLSLPWPLPQRPWQFLSRELVCLDWVARQTAIIAKRDRTQSGARLPWGRRLVRPLEEVGGAVQEYPLLATARSLTVLRALLAATHQLVREAGLPGDDHYPLGQTPV